MYKIQELDYGLKVTFKGYLSSIELEHWIDDSIHQIESYKSKHHDEHFNVIVDMKDLIMLSPDLLKIIKKGQKIYKNFGMDKSAVILDNSILGLQIKKTSMESGIYEWERYINYTNEKVAFREAKEWILKDIDPDEKY